MCNGFIIYILVLGECLEDSAFHDELQLWREDNEFSATELQKKCEDAANILKESLIGHHGPPIETELKMLLCYESCDEFAHNLYLLQRQVILFQKFNFNVLLRDDYLDRLGATAQSLKSLLHWLKQVQTCSLSCILLGAKFYPLKLSMCILEFMLIGQNFKKVIANAT